MPRSVPSQAATGFLPPSSPLPCCLGVAGADSLPAHAPPPPRSRPGAAPPQTRAQAQGHPLKKPGAYNTDLYYQEKDEGYGDVGVDQVQPGVR